MRAAFPSSDRGGMLFSLADVNAIHLELHLFRCAYITHTRERRRRKAGAIEHKLDAVELKMDCVITFGRCKGITRHIAPWRMWRSGRTILNNAEIAFAPLSLRVIDTVGIIGIIAATRRRCYLRYCFGYKNSAGKISCAHSPFEPFLDCVYLEGHGLGHLCIDFFNNSECLKQSCA